MYNLQKKVFEKQFSIPVDEQLVLFEKSYSGWNTPPYEKLTDPEAKLRKDHFVWDGAKLYLECTMLFFVF